MSFSNDTFKNMRMFLFVFSGVSEHIHFYFDAASSIAHSELTEGATGGVL